MGDLWFVTGGARSGKSTYAERLASETGRPVVYLATMIPGDDELQERVARHRAQRPEAWTTVEAPRAIAAAVADAPPQSCIILDCLSLWVTNHLLALGEDPASAALDALEVKLDREVDAMVKAAAVRIAPLIAVTNEVGSGLVPPYPLGRAYRDLLGRVNQRVAHAADRAWVLISGRALELPPP